MMSNKDDAITQVHLNNRKGEVAIASLAPQVISVETALMRLDLKTLAWK
jgi:hypothetical protein